MTQEKFALAGEDNGNCRVYYKIGRRLFCWQLDCPGKFKFFVCSPDGEPSHECLGGECAPLPTGETTIGRELRTYLENQNGKTT